MPQKDVFASTATICEPPFSDTSPGWRINFAPRYHWADTSSSLSVSVIDVPLTLRPDALPETEIVSLPSTDVSCAGVSVKVPVPVVDAAGIVTVKSETGP